MICIGQQARPRAGPGTHWLWKHSHVGRAGAVAPEPPLGGREQTRGAFRGGMPG